MTEWIVIPNWDTFQHYRDRDPTWIKLHRTLASNPDWLGLSGHCRAVLVGLWLEYASSNGQLVLDTRSLSSRLHLRVSSMQLESLSRAGFIAISASRPLALTRSRELEKKKKRGVGVTRDGANTPDLNFDYSNLLRSVDDA